MKRLIHALSEFYPLSEETRKEFEHILTFERYRKKEKIANLGEVPSKFYVLMSGVVRSFITDEKGKYVLGLKKNSSYKLQVSYIGMKTAEESISTAEADINRDFSLQNDNALDEVELIYEMPVTVKGDTLIYNADSFNTGTERKLEDVLKNLPGVEINADGQIEVEGKVVSKVMVEGKDFFDGDSKLATKNIPSDAVDKVQVLRNYSEDSQLSGVTNNQDNLAINLKLKEGKKNFWFEGNIRLGMVEASFSIQCSGAVTEATA